MSETIPGLRVARPGDLPVPLPLNQAAAMCVDGAELFALSLDGEELTSDGGMRAAYLLGLAEAHLTSLVAIIRAVVQQFAPTFAFGLEELRVGAQLPLGPQCLALTPRFV